jgi:hypothetical protein
MSFDLNDMSYTIQYWNERDAEWRGTGSGTIYDRDTARQRMRALAEQCDHCVRFRLEPQGPTGSVQWL